MDDLISGEVAKGTLTSDQATTLKNLLSSQKGGGQDGDRGDRVGGAGGPPPGPPPSGDAGAAGSTDAASSASDLLASFLKQLQGAQAQNQASGYGASGSAQKGSQAAVFDFRV
ncbi:hypothetical protein [Methylobacterium frigidaeris]|uniref:Uncharacterized protein n=1 Tax=Methylobacterium frigidaeris TaxID=2038277 RepID=A0AA37HCY3_9HYPH|nr:hypothetical protein [Methylobacterium frigidaeris]GJD63680.1 hypothetical protein MPEAHAMD_3851 [Methylobacterium frigidaeris]